MDGWHVRYSVLFCVQKSRLDVTNSALAAPKCTLGLL